MVTFHFTLKEKDFYVSSNTGNPYEIVRDIRNQKVNILSKENTPEPRTLRAVIIEAFGTQYPLKSKSKPLELGNL
ncbi:MAG: hypothetical protein QG670_2033 [Thermoproteota archaeon]|nr:hypothetical protein [Thermoproteota archaeon]